MEYEFETARLRVRKFRPEDAQSLYKIHAEDAVRKWIPNECYADPEEARDAIRFFLDHSNHNQLPYVLAVESRDTGELIGDTGVNEVGGHPGEVEIGYVICQKHSGKGYSTELVSAMTDYIRSVFGPKIIYGRVLRGNDASVKILERNGYAFLTEESGAEDDPYGIGMLIYQKDTSL